MRRIRTYLIGMIVGALLLLGGQAVAQVPDLDLAEGPKHEGCYAPGATAPWKPFYYRVNPTDPCPTGWKPIDWVND